MFFNTSDRSPPVWRLMNTAVTKNAKSVASIRRLMSVSTPRRSARGCAGRRRDGTRQRAAWAARRHHLQPGAEAVAGLEDAGEEVQRLGRPGRRGSAAASRTKLHLQHEEQRTAATAAIGGRAKESSRRTPAAAARSARCPSRRAGTGRCSPRTPESAVDAADELQLRQQRRQRPSTSSLIVIDRDGPVVGSSYGRSVLSRSPAAACPPAPGLHRQAFTRPSVAIATVIAAMRMGRARVPWGRGSVVGSQ